MNNDNDFSTLEQAQEMGLLAEEFERIKKSKLLICSFCNSINVNKSLMTPNLNKTKKKQDIINEEKIKKILW